MKTNFTLIVGAFLLALSTYCNSSEEASRAYQKLDMFLMESTKCCEQYGISPGTSYLYKSGPDPKTRHAYTRAIDLQKILVYPSDYKGFSIKLQCGESYCIHQANYSIDGHLEIIDKVNNPKKWAMYIIFKDKSSRDEALHMLKSIPEGESTDPQFMYSTYGPSHGIRRRAPSYSSIKKPINTYQIVKIEKSSLNNQTLSKYISCSQGGVEIVTVNDSIGYYSDSAGKKHSNFHEAASASCN